MQQKIIFLILFLKLSTAQCPRMVNQWMIWNVGQGQWVTRIQNDSCTHYDFGGEIFSLKKIKPLLNQICKNKINQLYLSHAHWDHYSFYTFIIKNSSKTCWKLKPTEPLNKINVEIPYCSENLNNTTKLIFYDQTASNKNDTSSVLIQDVFLIPGDSSKKQEKKWVHNIPTDNSIRFMILGHHGSNTSTSDQLLKKLPQLQMAFATSRFKKYGHPHRNVIERLSQHRLNAIKTETWGSILIQ